MGIIELLTRVGEENVRVQNVEQATVGVRQRVRPRTTEITFQTDEVTPADFIRRPPRMVGLVVWLPADLVKQAQEASQ